MQVEFIWDEECPNVKKARANLMRALSRAEVPIRWQEWRRDDPDAPEHVKYFGSPTILVDGVDVDELPASADGNCCRIYTGADGSISGVPSVDAIVHRLQMAAQSPEEGADEQAPSSGRLHILGVVPGLVVALLPKMTCPLCWPAYAGLASALGLTFLLDTTWLLPISAAFLTLAVGSLAWRAKRRRGYGPFWLGIFAATVLLVSKFVFDQQLVVYTSAALLFVAAVWNVWPTRNTQPTCAACVEG